MRFDDHACLRNMFDPYIGQDIEVIFMIRTNKESVRGTLIQTTNSYMQLSGYGNISWDYWIDTSPVIYSYPIIL